MRGFGFYALAIAILIIAYWVTGNLTNGVSSSYDYYDFKKKITKLDEYHLYDNYLKVIDDNDKNYSFDEQAEYQKYRSLPEPGDTFGSG